MTSIDGETDGLGQTCEACNGAMTLIGRLPRIMLRPTVHVFRCFNCNSVTSTEHELSKPQVTQHTA